MRTLLLLALVAPLAIAQEADPPRVEWIWTADGDPKADAPAMARYFRKTFELPEAGIGAWLEIAADNAYVAYLNGVEVGAGDTWEKPDIHNVTKLVRAGPNTLAVKGINEGGPAGLLAVLHVLPQKGDEIVVGTDATWKATGAEYEDWMQHDCDDARWENALSLGPAPLAPWTSVDPFGELFTFAMSPETITPNNDGVKDEAVFTFRYAPGYRGAVETAIVGPDGVIVKQFAAPRKTEGSFSWDGRYETGGAVAPGGYRVETIAQSRGHETVDSRTVTVRRQLPWVEPENKMKDYFPIGVWYDGRVEGINVPDGCTNVPAGLDNAEQYYKKTFKDIRRRGLEVVVIPNTPPDYRDTLLNAADRTGVRIVLELAEIAWPEFGDTLALRHLEMLDDEVELGEALRGLLAPIKRHRSLLAYQLVDEPPPDLFGRWHLVNRILGAIDPEHPSFSALCREDALPRVGELATHMIVFDRYPLAKHMQPGDYDFRQFIALLDKLQAAAAENGVPFWMVIQAFEAPAGARYPTPEELRLMTYLSVAHNAKGLFYFLYNSKTQTERLQGLVDTSLEPLPVYDTVEALARELVKLRGRLLKLTPIDNTTEVEHDMADVQMFADPAGMKYLFLSNLNVVEGIHFSAGLRDVAAEVENVVTGETVPLDPSGEPRFAVDLGPGQTWLLRLKPL